MKKIGLFLFGIIVSVGFVFSQKSVNNIWSVNGYNELNAKQYFDNSPIDPIEGIWQSNDGFKFAIEKDVEDNNRTDKKYRVIILSHNVNSAFWKPTQIKGFIERTSINELYTMDYYLARDVPENENNIVVLTCLGGLESDVLFSFTRNDNGEKLVWVKLYPESKKNNNDNSTIENSQASSGTGFAISSNGFIVTNHHVIDGAKKIEIKGVSQNFNKSYSAEVIVSDEKNDLAIIKINDPLFTSFGSIPYTFRNNLADVGENIFVLGYPLPSTMGTEVKLTNGIISSRTGFQGDISTYQISAPIQSGNSGSPLFDNSGNIIGIVNAKHTLAESAGYAIKASYLRNLIEIINNPPELPSVNTISSKSLQEKSKVLKNFVFIVITNDFASSKNSNTPIITKKRNEEKTTAEYFTIGRNLYLQANKIENESIQRIEYLARADSAFDKVIIYAPESYLGYFWKGRVSSLRDSETTQGLAKPYYEKSMIMFEQNPDKEKYKRELIETYSYLGYYYYLKSDEDKQALKLSLSFWEKVLNIDPSNKGAKEAVSELQGMWPNRQNWR